jgi:hypothetical protein
MVRRNPRGNPYAVSSRINWCTYSESVTWKRSSTENDDDEYDREMYVSSTLFRKTQNHRSHMHMYQEVSTYSYFSAVVLVEDCRILVVVDLVDDDTAKAGLVTTDDIGTKAAVMAMEDAMTARAVAEDLIFSFFFAC